MMDDPIRLDGKRAIVTGGGRGIGRAIALTLARRGADVTVWDIDRATAAETAREVETFGRRGEAYTVDVARKADVDRAAAAAIEVMGGIDILVNNAGWDRFMPFVEAPEEFWDRVIAINYKGVLNCTRSVLDHMIAEGQGTILSIASDAGRVGSSGEAVYSGAKGAVIAFSKTMARELARSNITVNVVCPGPTDTDFLAAAEGTPQQPGAELIERIRRGIPFRRLARPQEIAEAVAFFVSPAAAYITGQTLSVSGGLTMA